MFYVYVIKNQNDKIYTGHTSDLINRLKRHNGILKNKSTSFTARNKGIWKLVHKEEFDTRKEAIKREKELKSFRGREFIKKLINKK